MIGNEMNVMKPMSLMRLAFVIVAISCLLMSAVSADPERSHERARDKSSDKDHTSSSVEAPSNSWLIDPNTKTAYSTARPWTTSFITDYLRNADRKKWYRYIPNHHCLNVRFESESNRRLYSLRESLLPYDDRLSRERRASIESLLNTQLARMDVRCALKPSCIKPEFSELDGGLNIEIPVCSDDSSRPTN